MEVFQILYNLCAVIGALTLLIIIISAIVCEIEEFNKKRLIRKHMLVYNKYDIVTINGKEYEILSRKVKVVKKEGNKKNNKNYDYY
mgnify:FL=1